MNNVQFGRKVENLIIRKLNEERIKAVLVPHRVIKGIDGLIIKNNYETFPIQIKGRKNIEAGQYVPSIKNFYTNFFIIFYSDKSKNFWIIPKKEYKEISNVSHNRLCYTKETSKKLEKFKNMEGIKMLKMFLK